MEKENIGMVEVRDIKKVINELVKVVPMQAEILNSDAIKVIISLSWQHGFEAGINHCAFPRNN